MFAICIPYTHGKPFSIDIYRTDLQFFSVYVKFRSVMIMLHTQLVERSQGSESIVSEWFTC